MFITSSPVHYTGKFLLWTRRKNAVKNFIASLLTHVANFYVRGPNLPLGYILTVHKQILS